MKNRNYDSLAVARRIRAAGRPIYIAEDDAAPPSIPSDALSVRQTGGVMESRAIDCSSCTAFIIYMLLTAKQPAFAISAFGLEVPWNTEHFHWLADPLELNGPSPCYRFHLPGVPDFERCDVINHYADPTRVLSSGHSLKGFLLAVGSDPMPGEFRHGMMIPAFVIVYDQLGRDYRSAVELQAVRNSPRPRVSRKRNLLDRPDPLPRR
jgi:hypothetical protein